MDKSTARRVHLRELILTSRGLYRCEVSEEAPSFHSAQAEAFMEVYCKYNRKTKYLRVFSILYLHIADFPRETPRITGHERAYKLKEPLDVNCSSAKSFPAPDLQWVIDGQKITDKSWLIAFGAKPASQGLLVSTLGLRAPTKPRMKLKCVATIGTHRRERTVIIGINIFLITLAV
ncbi:hypothetical protein HF086_006359 [Spodoptera exigua]|uniref:CD80-like immunoglobulin C2-set domain-containing protein n=1 Tax=Spodoptera exigua TaxID=7107 RepID=A0A922MR88_SPOEX|nr:hypothetical protein HF086_006359 [Spodoptera exigua]